MKKGNLRKKLRLDCIQNVREKNSPFFTLFQLSNNILKYRKAFNFILKNKNNMNAESFKVFETQYISGLITCSETYLHDFIAVLLINDSSLKRRIYQELSGSDSSLQVDPDTFLSNHSLQKLDNIKKIFKLLSEDNMIKSVGSQHFVFSPDANLICTNLDTIYSQKKISWWDIIHTVYRERHISTHIAHLPPNSDYFVIFEQLLIMFLQIFTGRISIKLGINRVCINTSEKYLYLTDDESNDEELYIFTLKDMFSDNWSVVQ